jgi:hypothetical protein
VSRVLPILFLLVLALAVAPQQASAHCAGGSHRVIGEVPPPPDDLDCDFVKDNVDNCPPLGYDDLRTRNPNQEDTDRDGVGDWCEADDDGDGIFDWADRKVEYESSKVKLDNCRTVFNRDQADDNNNRVGNACERDDDHDGVLDSEDNCKGISNPDQADLDNDRVGDACDSDADGDYARDTEDNCPGYPNPDQLDADGDGRGALCDDNDTPPSPAPSPPTPTPRPAGDVARVVDRQAPLVTVRLKSRNRLEEVEDGLVVGLSCSEACTTKAQLVVSRAVARRLRLPSTIVAGSPAARVDGAGSTYAFVRFDRAARRRLWKAARSSLTLRIDATDPAGNVRRVSRPLTLVR